MLRAEVWEIWDRRARRRLWIAGDHPRPARIDEDPYGLEGFLPLPEPLRDVDDTETLVPTPPLSLYRDQADDLDEITSRISRLTRALRRAGVYDGSVPELRRLARAGDNEFIPVANYGALSEKGGLPAAFQTEDLSSIAEVLARLYEQRNQLVQQIYELTGVSDILRGTTDPNETLGAQSLKAQFGSQRLRRRQRAVQRWISESLKLKAEIIASHFEPDILAEMTNIPVTPDVVALLRSDRLRSYRIEVETDSTIFEDAEADKRARAEVVTAATGLLQQAIPAVEKVPELGDLLFEILGFGLRGFKAGRELEDAIERTGEAIRMRGAGSAGPRIGTRRHPTARRPTIRASRILRRDEAGMSRTTYVIRDGKPVPKACARRGARAPRLPRDGRHPRLPLAHRRQRDRLALAAARARAAPRRAPGRQRLDGLDPAVVVARARRPRRFLIPGGPRSRPISQQEFS